MGDAVVSFYLPKLTTPDEYDGVDPDTDWARFRTARGQAIPHTYVRLRRAGHDVALTNRPPTSGIVVVFAGDMRRFAAQRPVGAPLVTVCVQADRRVPDVDLADVIVQHNGLRADDRRRFFIPNWPQPGLVPRDPDRGPQVRTVVFKGALANLDPAFLSPAWEDELDARGLTFVLDADLPPDALDGFGAAIRAGSSGAWHDYREADVVLAVRPPSRDRYRHKPAVKLVNAWRAGVPALLGPEPAYRELRRSELDHVEVATPDEALGALDRLRQDPDRYERMVANGRDRAEAFSVEGVTRSWESLFDTLRDRRPPRLPRAMAPVTVPPRRAWRGVRRRATRLVGGASPSA